MSVETSTRKGAMRYAVGAHSRPASPTFGEYAERWIESQRNLALAGVIRPNSIMRFESALAAHLLPAFSAYRLDDLSRDRCEAFRSALYASGAFAPRTVNAIFAVLRQILRRAIQDQEMHVPDPTDGVRPLLAPRRRFEVYSPYEVRILLLRRSL